MSKVIRKIHHLSEQLEERWSVDPQRGIVKERYSVVSPSNMNVIAHEGEVYKITREGCFEVPEIVARFYLGRPGWHEGLGMPIDAPSATEISAELLGARKES